MSDDKIQRNLHHDSNPGTAGEVGEAAGGISGAVTGAALGSATGPIGTVVGGIAGAVGGWWAGRAVAEKASGFHSEDDGYYRERYEHSPRRLADRDYEHVRPAYQLGHLARQNPDYRNQSFEAIEAELRAGWSEEVTTKHGDWDHVREFAREAYTSGGSISRREAKLKGMNSEDNLGDRVVNAERKGADRVSGAIDDARAAARDEASVEARQEARLDLPTSRR